MSDTLFVKLRDSDYWENGDYVKPRVAVEGQFTVGKDYQIKWIDWSDVVHVDDDSGKENGWHVSQWKFVKEVVEMKCIVKGCTNHTHEGVFVGDLCKPCHIMLTTGKLNPSNAWFVKAIEGAKEELLKDFLKDVTVTSKTNGEVVAVTLTDEEHRIYKVLWERDKK